MHVYLSCCVFCISPPESNAKSVDGKSAEAATTSAPCKPQNGDHQPPGDKVNGFISPAEETVPAPQLSAGQRGTAAPPNTPADEPASMTQTPPAPPAQLQDGPRPGTPAAPRLDETPPQPPPSLSTNGFSLDSADTSVLSPFSLSDSDRGEDVVDGSSSLVSERATPEESENLNTSSPDTDNNVKHSSVTEDKQPSLEESFLSEAVGQKMKEESERVIVRTHREALSDKHSEAKVGVVQFDEGITKCDVQDEPEDLPSASEATSPSPKAEPKKQPKLFKRSKKKSNPGKLYTLSNKDCSWNASLFLCFKRKPLLVLILLQLIFCMMYCLF